MPRRQAFLVLGMHRSGTSSVAGTLVKLGIAAPKTLLGANEGNERGHWESSVLIAFHDEMLASAGSRWDDWRPFNEDWYATPVAESFKARGKQLLAEEFGDAPAFVLKDPRTCRFARFWLEIFKEEGIDARVLLPLRSPLEVAQSHRSRDGFSLRKGLLLWLRHVLDAEAASRNMPRALFEWSHFLRDWRASMERVAGTLGVRWPALTDVSAAEIERFLSRDLKHQRVAEDDLAAHPELHAWVLEAYEELRKLVREPVVEGRRARLDDLRRRFDEASALFGSALAEMEVEQAEIIRVLHVRDEELKCFIQESEEQKRSFREEHEIQHQALLQAERQSHNEEVQRLMRESGENEARLWKEHEDRLRLLKVEQQTHDERIHHLLQESEANEVRLREVYEDKLIALRTELLSKNKEIDTLVQKNEQNLTDLQEGIERKYMCEREDYEAHTHTLQLKMEQILSENFELNKSLEAANLSIADFQEQVGEESLMLAQVNSMQQRVFFLEAQLGEVRSKHSEEVDSIKKSTSWRVTRPLRALKWGPKLGLKILVSLPAIVRSSGGVLPIFGKALGVCRREGLFALIQKTRKYLNNREHNYYQNRFEGVRDSNKDLSEEAKPKETLSTLQKAERFFDREWYFESYLRKFGINTDPYQHYLLKGNVMGLYPHPLFNTGEYYLQFVDAAQGEPTALHHFIKRVEVTQGLSSAPSYELRLLLKDLLSRRKKEDNSINLPPQVSFIIPVYNGGEFLEDAVLSALCSTNFPCEIIIVNDGSTEESTKKEIERIGNEYSVTIIHKPNGGLSSARNAGIRRASAPAIKFLDCDDLLWPDSTDSQIGLLQRSGAAVALGEYRFCREDGGHWLGPDRSTIEPYSFTEESFFQNWENGLSIPIHSALFLTELVKRHPFKENVRAKEDWLFWMEIAENGANAVYDQGIVALYRIHGNNMCSDTESMGMEYLRASFFHMTKNVDRIDHIISHFRNAYLGTIKANAINSTIQKEIN